MDNIDEKYKQLVDIANHSPSFFMMNGFNHSWQNEIIDLNDKIDFIENMESDFDLVFIDGKYEDKRMKNNG